MVEKTGVINKYAVMLIISLIAAVLIRIWAADREASIVGPIAIRTDEKGDISLISANTLYIHDADGQLLDRIPLEKFGVDQFIGDFWILRNGEILLRRGVQQKPTFFREIQMFLRIGSGKQDAVDEGKGILQRCNLTTSRCEQIGSGRDAFKKMTTFRLAIDEEKGNVFISDTLDHRLLLYDMQGNLRRKSDLSFKFPNGMLLAEDGLLYVADTNHHRVCGVSTEFASFGKIEREFSIIANEGTPGNIWPSSILLSDNRFWVINSGNDMQNGDVMVYDREGTFIKRVNLPGDADPMALTASGNHILITDPTRMRIYRANQNGSIEDDFGSLLLNIELHELQRERARYSFCKNASLGVLIVLLIMTFALVRKARKAEKGPETAREKTASMSKNTAAQSQTRRYDYHNQLETIKYGGTAAALLLIIVLIVMSAVAGGDPSRARFLRTFRSAVVTTMAALVGAYFTQKRTYFEVSDQGILAVTGKKKIFSPWHQVREVKIVGAGKLFAMCILKTDEGKIKIGNVEPADTPVFNWRNILKKPAGNPHFTALIDEIQMRAPQAEMILPRSARPARRR